MKRNVFLCLMFACLVSCTSNGNKSETQVEESAVVSENSNESKNPNEEVLVKDFLTTLYDDYVFGNQDFSAIKTHFSEDVLKRLKDEYEYDDEEGYAVWLFKTDAQDGPSDVCQVSNVNKEENGWYAVEYVDMGIKGKCLFSVQLRDNEVFVSDFKQ